MIKLIASDIDGTLIRDSTPDLYPEMVEAIRELTAQGIIFCATSGRQYHSIKHVFRDVADKIVYIAENGAHIRCYGRDVKVTPMVPDHAREIIQELRAYRDTCELIVSTPKGSYVENTGGEFMELLTAGYHNRTMQTEDLLKVREPVIKISIYRKNSIRELGESIFIPEWKDKVKVTVAGEEWVDFMDASVDKGNALRSMMEFFGIKKEECMAFGDNSNDIGLLHAAGFSYAVENARDEVKAAADYICPSYDKKGVYQVVKDLIIHY